MKKLITIFLVVTFFSTGFTQDSDTITMIYQKGIKLSEIPTPGNKFIFKQLCTSQIDSIITTGNIKFKHSKVGRIKDCIFEWKIVRDTLAAISIETSSEKQTDRLLKQIFAQYGEPLEIIQGVDFLYHRYLVEEMHSITAGLHISEDRTTGKLVVRKK